MWERWATFFSKIHIKSTIPNREIVLFFKVTNWLSTVKLSKIHILNFPRTKYFKIHLHLQN
jgi:hypothetical protein